MKKYVLVLTAILSYTILPAQQLPSKTENLNSLFEHCYQNNLFNGNVLISTKNDILLKRSYGYCDLASEHVLLSDDAFLLASVSKQFTVMAMVLLHEEGKVNYDDLVIKHLQEFPYDNITIRHLLTHTSGLKEYTSLVNAQIDRFKERFEQHGEVFDNTSVLRLFRNNAIPLDFDPGTEFSYSNTGYVFLAVLLEAISGLPLKAFLQTKIFGPLELKNTFLKEFKGVDSNVKNQELRALDAFEQNILNGEVQIKKVPEFLQTYGDGGIYSTTEDLFKWFNALDNEVLISKRAQMDAYETYSENNRDFPYGFGWFVRKHPMNGNRILTHSGKFMGFTNAVFRDLDEGFISIVLSNNSHSINREINSAIVKILYGQPFAYPKIPAANILLKQVVSKGTAAAIAVYEKCKEDIRYDFSESAINTMGYLLLRDKRTKAALDIFKWNATRFPNSSNVYDSLAEAQLALGKLEEACLNYKKSLELNGENENAKLMLEKINQKG
ncbi:MAG: serine hydrolase domain-containing protein [Bacteroidota bacterium]